MNDNNENKHTVQHINEPEEVLVENNKNKNKSDRRARHEGT